MCNKGKKDHRPFKERFLDCYYNKPWKMVLYTFLGSVALLIFSILTGMKGGTICIFSYPVSLPFYAMSLHVEKMRIKKKTNPILARSNPIEFVIILWFLPLALFILSLLGVEL